jgi:hypothetical protein
LLSSEAIGGYFELELPAYQEPYLDALTFQSARAAFYALVKAGKPDRVWVPRYLCGSMLAPLIASGIETVFYSIDSTFSIVGQLDLQEKDWLMYVNYFGVCSANVTQLLSNYNPDQVVIDNSQAFFDPPRNCLATIYSPRKFFGLPDGGLLFSLISVPQPAATDTGSLDRTRHLLIRLSESPEAGYDEYQRAEESLGDIEPLRMSRLTQRLLSAQNYEDARQKRRNNFAALHERLGSLNELSLNISEVDGPLCYPFLSDRVGARDMLIENRIFVPRYWPDVLSRVDRDSREFRLVNDCLPLPCDQRYTADDCQIVADHIHQAMPGKRCLSC